MSEKKDQEFVIVKTDNHRYRLPIMNTIDGVGFAVKYQAVFDKDHGAESLLLWLKETAKDYENLFYLTTNLLSGAEIDGEKCDEIGMCSLFRKKPSELYEAIYISMVANFRDCFPFFAGTGDTEENL